MSTPTTTETRIPDGYLGLSQWRFTDTDGVEWVTDRYATVRADRLDPQITPAVTFRDVSGSHLSAEAFGGGGRPTLVLPSMWVDHADRHGLTLTHPGGKCWHLHDGGTLIASICGSMRAGSRPGDDLTAVRYVVGVLGGLYEDSDDPVTTREVWAHADNIVFAVREAS